MEYTGSLLDDKIERYEQRIDRLRRELADLDDDLDEEDVDDDIDDDEDDTNADDTDEDDNEYYETDESDADESDLDAYEDGDNDELITGSYPKEKSQPRLPLNIEWVSWNPRRRPARSTADDNGDVRATAGGSDANSEPKLAASQRESGREKRRRVAHTAADDVESLKVAFSDVRERPHGESVYATHDGHRKLYIPLFISSSLLSLYFFNFLHCSLIMLKGLGFSGVYQYITAIVSYCLNCLLTVLGLCMICVHIMCTPKSRMNFLLGVENVKFYWMTHADIDEFDVDDYDGWFVSILK